jgi:hypothetical protein
LVLVALVAWEIIQPLARGKTVPLLNSKTLFLSVVVVVEHTTLQTLVALVVPVVVTL